MNGIGQLVNCRESIVTAPVESVDKAMLFFIHEYFADQKR